MKKKRPLSILKDKLPNGNPFDYLLALKEGGMQAVYEEEFIEGLGDEGEKLLNTDVDSEIDICEQIRRLAESRVIVPRDLRVDDGDIPTAKNFYEWCTQDRFGTIGDERPFIEQMIWGLIAFNEVCYQCSDIEWLIHDHKVDDTFAKLERKVQLLEFGVCPACGVGRSQAFKQGIMPFYNELAINAGQRCVIGTTPILTPQGLKHISEMYPDAPEGFSEFNAEVYNGKWLERTSHFFKAKPEPVTRLTTDTGFCVVGTKDHPVKSGSEFVTLYDLEPGAPIPIYVGTQVYGQVNYQNAYQLGTQFYDSSVPQHVRQFDQSSTHEWLKGVFRSRMHAFVTDIALRDVSAMLLNAGFMHSIDGPAIVMTEQQHQDLLANNPQTFVYQDKVKSLEIEGEAETYDFTLPSTHQFITGGLLSHNSGKSHTLGTYLYPYYNHRLMKLQSPPTFYGLSRTTRLQGTFAALTFTQAKDTLWTPFYGAITQTSWYKQYHNMLKHYGNVYGEKLFKLNENFVDYRARALFWHPMSPDLRVMRGRTRVAASIDEIAYFDADKDTKKVTIGGHEIYDALANSLATVRTASEILLERGYDDVFPAYMMNVTSPVSKADMIHILLERAKNSKSIFGITRATWEVNPNFKRNSQFIMEQYRRDPISADRNFGANPPAVSNPFFTNHKQIQDCESEHKNLVKVAPVLKKSKKLGQGYMYGELVKVKKSGKASLMALDAGMVDNSFSLVLGSTDSYNLTIDLVCEIMTVPGYPINFTKMYDELILPLMRARNVKVLLADRWNSKMLLDTAVEDMADYDSEEDTFIAESYSLKYQDFVSIKTLMEMGRLKLPKSEMDVKKLLEATDGDYREFYNEKPVAHLFKQLYTVKDLTKTVGKGDGYTDDSFRAMALCVHGLQSEKYEILLSQEQFNMEVARPAALGASRLYSGGGGTVGSGGGGPTLIGGAPIGMIGKGRSR